VGWLAFLLERVHDVNFLPSARQKATSLPVAQMRQLARSAAKKTMA
jgi:hypothetical protein